MAFELSRIDRLTKTYDLAARFPDLDGPFTAAEVALLSPRTNPTSGTPWTAVTVNSGIATALFAGPDADSSGAVVVTGSADLWLKVTDAPETDAKKIERITLLGGSSVAAMPPTYVTSVAGLSGPVSAQGLADALNVSVGAGVATGVAAADTARIQAAIDTAATAGGGVVQLRAGTYIVTTLQIKTGVTLRGEGIGATRVKLANGTNADLVTVPNFATLNGGNTSGGETKWAIEHLTLDGNGANQTGTSWPLRVYAYNYRIDDVQIENGLSGNAYSKWGSSAGGDMEAIWTRFKLLAPVSDTAVNLDWNGPHDSIFDGGEIVAKGNAITLHQTGIWTHGNAGGDQFTNVHVWGFHQFGWIAENSINAINCDAEGAWEADVALLAGRCNFRGRVFGSNDANNATAVGVRIGDGTHTSIKNCHVDVDVFGFPAGAFPFHFSSSGGRNRITGTGILGAATAPFTGPLNAADYIDVTFQDGTEDQSKHQLPHPLNIRSTSTSALAVGKVNYDAQNNNWDINGATLIRGYKDSHVTQTLFLDTSNGAIVPGTTTGTGARLFSGTGAPTMSGIAGDFYFRKDPTTGNERIYQNASSGVNWSPIDDAPAESIYLDATQFQIASGTPTLTSAPGAAAWPRWLLDAAAVEIVATTLMVPKGWATANVFLWHFNEGAGTGAVRYQVRAHTDRASGASVTTSETTHGLVDVTMGAQGILTRTQVGSALTVSAASTTLPRPLMGLSVRRLAADGADTLANDAALVGVELVRAS